MEIKDLIKLLEKYPKISGDVVRICRQLKGISLLEMA